MANTEEGAIHDGRSESTGPGADAGPATATGPGADAGSATATGPGAAGDGPSRPGSAPGGPARGPGGKFLARQPDAGPGARKRKRGRPAGAKSKSAGGAAGADARAEKPQAAKLALSKLDEATLARVLAFAHSSAALTLKLPALALSDEEARKLARAVAELAAQYEIAVSARLMAWLQLLGVSAAIYGPRAVAIMAAKSMTRAAPSPAASSSAAAAGAPRMDFSADRMPGATVQ